MEEGSFTPCLHGPFIRVARDPPWPGGLLCADVMGHVLQKHLPPLVFPPGCLDCVSAILRLNLATENSFLSRVAQNKAVPVRNLYTQRRGFGLLGIQTNPSLPWRVSNKPLSRTCYPYDLSLKLFLIHGAPANSKTGSPSTQQRPMRAKDPESSSCQVSTGYHEWDTGDSTSSGSSEETECLLAQKHRRKKKRLRTRVRRMEASEGVESVWNEAGEIYGDLYLTVHTKAIMG